MLLYNTDNNSNALLKMIDVPLPELVRDLVWKLKHQQF